MAVTASSLLVPALHRFATRYREGVIVLGLFILLTIVSLLNFAFTIFFVRQLSGRRLLVELASLVVPGVYLAVLGLTLWAGIQDARWEGKARACIRDGGRFDRDTWECVPLRTPEACHEAGGIWDAQHTICRDDQTASAAMERYGVPDRPPKAAESN
jgi:hypothetical protein